MRWKNQCKQCHEYNVVKTFSKNKITQLLCDAERNKIGLKKNQSLLQQNCVTVSLSRSTLIVSTWENIFTRHCFCKAWACKFYYSLLLATRSRVAQHSAWRYVRAESGRENFFGQHQKVKSEVRVPYFFVNTFCLCYSLKNLCYSLGFCMKSVAISLSLSGARWLALVFELLSKNTFVEAILMVSTNLVLCSSFVLLSAASPIFSLFLILNFDRM